MLMGLVGVQGVSRGVIMGMLVMQNPILKGRGLQAFGVQRVRVSARCPEIPEHRSSKASLNPKPYLKPTRTYFFVGSL